MLLSLLVLLVQCQRRPDAVLSRDRMKEVSKDMALAQSFLESKHITEDSIREAYFLSVLEKHKVSVATYDTSLAWYGENIPLMTDIQNELVEELRNDAVQLDTLRADSVRKSQLSYDRVVSLWNEPTRIAIEREQRYYYISGKVSDGWLNAGDTIDLRLRLVPGLEENEKLSVLFLTLRTDTTIVRSERRWLTSETGSRVQLTYILPPDSTAMEERDHLIQLTYLRSSTTPRAIPLLLDSIAVRMRIPPEEESTPVLEEEIQEMESEGRDTEAVSEGRQHRQENKID